MGETGHLNRVLIWINGSGSTAGTSSREWFCWLQEEVLVVGAHHYATYIASEFEGVIGDMLA